MIAAAISPTGVFLFLLNSSGAVILFVYGLIAVSQLVLRRRTDPARLRLKMWLFPYLTIAAIVAMLAILVGMYMGKATRPQLLLSLLAWGVVLVGFAANKWRQTASASSTMRLPFPAPPACWCSPTRPSVLPSCSASYQMDRSDKAEYFVCVPANPVDTHQTEHAGAVWVWQATVKAAQERLDSTLAALRAKGLKATGALGDYRPLVALQEAVVAFRPDRVVIATHPDGRSVWLLLSD